MKILVVDDEELLVKGISLRMTESWAGLAAANH